MRQRQQPLPLLGRPRRQAEVARDQVAVQLVDLPPEVAQRLAVGETGRTDQLTRSSSPSVSSNGNRLRMVP
jgi:hypothetical protein